MILFGMYVWYTLLLNHLYENSLYSVYGVFFHTCFSSTGTHGESELEWSKKLTGYTRTYMYLNRIICIDIFWILL